MTKISEKLNIIKNAKDNIKTSIENKGVVVGDVSIEEYASKIDEMQVANVEINDCSYLFYNGARSNNVNEILTLCKNVTNTQNMFYGCSTLKTLDLSNFNTSNVTNMNSMFEKCSQLQELDLSNFDFRNVLYMGGLCNGCSNLQNVVLGNTNYYATSGTTNLSYLFNSCNKLINLDLSNLDASSVVNINSILASCTKLENLIFFSNLGKGYTQKTPNYSSYTLSLSSSTKLTHDSLMDVINKLYDLNLTYDVANGGTLYTQKLTIGSTNVAKLTAEEIAIATNKGWVVS